MCIRDKLEEEKVFSDFINIFTSGGQTGCADVWSLDDTPETQFYTKLVKCFMRMSNRNNTANVTNGKLFYLQTREHRNMWLISTKFIHTIIYFVFLSGDQMLQPFLFYKSLFSFIILYK